MKRLLIIAALSLASYTAFAWGNTGHPVVAQVADNHISKQTRKALKKYLPGTNIIEVSSDADKNYYVWSRDIGFECSNPKILRRQPSEPE